MKFILCFCCESGKYEVYFVDVVGFTVVAEPVVIL